MICLDKADAATFRHLTWNQSPPALAAHHTTREDLNGISNKRQYVAAGQHDAHGGGAGSPLGPGVGSDDWACQHGHRPGSVAAALGAGRWFNGLSFPLHAVAGGDGHLRPVRVPSSEPCPPRLWSWTTWILSVLLSLFLLSSMASLASRSLLPHPQAVSIAAASDRDAAPPVSLRLDLPRAVLSKRATCAAGGVEQAEYNTPLHAGTLLIVWFVSSLACCFPIMAAKFPGLRIPRRFFFAVRHFGTGVLIATAFVHLLPTAFVSLGNPCLGDFWTRKYQAMPGVIALAAIFLVTVIEMLLHPSRHIPPPPLGSGTPGNGHAPPEGPAPGRHLCCGTAMLSFRGMGPTHSRASTMTQGLSQLNDNYGVDDHAYRDEADEQPKHEHRHDGGESPPELRLSPELKRRKERLQCILLEMGILFHSVFIGMALSVSAGTDFVVLLIAIVFHQTFEGLALGARIAAIEWEHNKWQPWIMALTYGCTTPIGQALGLATHTLYSPDSEVGLVVVGVMNAISAGLLTFASLVELLSEDFLSDESWSFLRGKARVGACFLVFLGAFFMSLVGAWA